MTTLNYTDTLVVQSCCVCFMTFGVPASFDKQRIDDHRSFYCPAGHSQSYVGKTEAQKLRERAERLERDLANGTCPCCQRSFSNLQRHMANQHADYVEAHG